MASINNRILVIDDVESIHQDFRKILVPEVSKPHQKLDEMDSMILGKKAESSSVLPAFEIDSAYQSQEAIDLVKKSKKSGRPYAMAFVDVQMPPGDDGVETISRIWEMDSEIQTVICTAYAKYSWEDLLKRFGNTDRLFYLKKPFDNIEVIQMAFSLINRWNLNHAINEQLAQLKKGGVSSQERDIDMENSINSLKETREALQAFNKKLKSKIPTG
jgi:CheY-like chemotaxis protein